MGGRNAADLLLLLSHAWMEVMWGWDERFQLWLSQDPFQGLSQLADWAEGGFGASQAALPEQVSHSHRNPDGQIPPGRVCSCLGRRTS